MFARTLAGSALAVVFSAVAAPVASADFALVSQDLTINRQADTVAFSLTFNQAPNFGYDAATGTPVDSFQVEFEGAATMPGDLTAVVRGDEIHVSNAVRIRSATGNGGADSGGWGPIVGSVPFALTGDTIKFAVPTSELGWTGGGWSANVYSFAAGDLTAAQSASSIPTPPAFWAGLAGLAVVAGLSAHRAHVRRRTGRAYFAG